MYDTSVLYMEHGWMNPDYYKFSKQYFTKRYREAGIVTRHDKRTTGNKSADTCD